MAKVKKPVKVVGIALLAAGAYFGIKKWQNRSVEVGPLTTVGKVAIPDDPNASLSGQAAVKLPLPSNKPTQKDGLLNVKWDMMAWQSQNGALLANGGAETTEGSLFEQAGLHVSINRQDNCSISMANMITYCKDYAAGKTKDGYFVTYMGSGIPNYITSMWNDAGVKKLPADQKPVAWLTFGKSYGEDQVIGSEEFKANKQALKGKVLRGVRMDGDIDLALKLCADNDIKVNADPKLYYSDALNLSYVSSDNGSFLTAVVDYNNNMTETRKVVRDGKTMGDTTVHIDLVATWTPGDVNAVQGRGGVTIISTREYASIMPNITITSRKFLNDHREAMKNLVVALATAGDQIRTFEDAKAAACAIGTKVWNEHDAKYWLTYYNGEQKGQAHLGGSMVFNLKDMAFVLGLDGSRDTYRDIYNTFGKLQTGYYKEDFPTYIDYAQAFDKSIIRDVYDSHPELLEGKALKIDYSATTTETVGSKPYNIQFATGSAAVTSKSALDDIAEQVSTSEGTQIFVEGHTDNVGNPDANKELSKRRAQAVVDYLVSKGIDADRFKAVEGYGDTKPVANNATDAGRAKNRRVQIVLKK